MQRISVRTHDRFIQLDSDLFEGKDSVIHLLNHWGQNDIIPSKRKSSSISCDLLSPDQMK